MADQLSDPAFAGHAEFSADERGRVAIPEQYKEQLGQEFVIVGWPPAHVRLYPRDKWEHIRSAANLYNTKSDSAWLEFNPIYNMVQRALGDFDICTCERSSGKLLIPGHLRRWLNLNGNEPMVMVGAGARLELWKRTSWDEYQRTHNTDLNWGRLMSALQQGDQLPVDILPSAAKGPETQQPPA